jgi:hypothetical protein
MRKRPILLTVLAFAVTGPLIGALLVIVWAVVSVAVSKQPDAFNGDFTRFASLVLAWAYALAWLPATIMGLCWAVLCVRFNGARSLTFPVRAIAGACLGLAFGAIAGILWDWSASTALIRTRLIYFSIPCSVIAGSLLCSAFPRAIWLQHRPLTIGSSDRGETSSVSQGESR